MNNEVDFELEAMRLGLPLYLKSKAAARMMSCGPTKLRELIQDNHIEAVKRGKDLLVRTSSVLRFNASLPPAKFSLQKSKHAA
jgi:excisionase family DNA binding protein